MQGKLLDTVTLWQMYLAPWIEATNDWIYPPWNKRKPLDIDGLENLFFFSDGQFSGGFGC